MTLATHNEIPPNARHQRNRSSGDVAAAGRRQVLVRPRSQRNLKSTSRDPFVVGRVMQSIQREYPDDPRTQISEFLARVPLLAAIGRSREVAETTRSHVGSILNQVVTDLQARRVHLHKIGELSQKQVINLVKYWKEAQHTDGTIQWRISILRRFLTQIGKPDVIPKGRPWERILAQHGIVLGHRSSLPDLPKGWVDMGIDARSIIEGVRNTQPVLACALDMMWAFGLRYSESIQLQPRKSDKGEFLLIYRGTKGGKVREVPFSKVPERLAWQKSVLATAKELSDAHPRGLLALKGVTLAQMKNRFRYVLREHGVTRGGVGATPHGLRHQYGTELFHELTGLPAPVLEQVPQHVYEEHKELVQSALLEVSRRLGHERPSISGAYLSSVAKVNRVANARLTAWLGKLGACSDLFAAADVQDAWIVGKAGAGLSILPGAAMQLAARVSQLNPHALAQLDQLAAGVGDRMGMRVTVTAWTTAEVPDDGAEILFAV